MSFLLSAFADEAASELTDQIRALSQYGIRFVEFRSADGKNVSDLTGSEAVEAVKRLQDAGIGVSSLGSPIGKIDIQDDFGPHYEKFLHTLDLAEIMHSPFIRLFSFYIPHDMDPAAFRNQVLDRLSAFAEAAKGRPVTLLHENEKAIYGDTPERCADLLAGVASEKLKAAYDFSNFVQCGCDNRSAWQLLKDQVVYFHLKDSLYTNEEAVRDLGRQVTGNAHRPLGQGDGCAEEILEDALRRGFSGFASVEPHLGEEYGAGSEERFGVAAEAAIRLIQKIEGEE